VLADWLRVMKVMPRLKQTVKQGLVTGPPYLDEIKRLEVSERSFDGAIVNQK
jgi:hypothetical protein